MRVLITNQSLAARTGSALYAYELAEGLIRRGHLPIAYSTQLGEVADAMRAATVPVVENLESVSEPPDIIHGQHHIETMTALMHFPGVPAIYFCHGWLPWEEKPPRFPRILRYVAVDDTCRDRLVCEEAIPEARTRVIRNYVDLDRFKSRLPLPERPARALIFSNNANRHSYLRPIQQACENAGIRLEVIGSKAGNVHAQPELALAEFDLVFAKGRSAFEALAVGAAVILCDEVGLGPMVTESEVDRLHKLNFGVRTLRNQIDPELITREIQRYDPHDAARVSQRVRSFSGKEEVIDELAALYEEVIREHQSSNGSSPAESQFISDYLRGLGIEVRKQRETVQQSAAFRLGDFLIHPPLLGRLTKRLFNDRR